MAGELRFWETRKRRHLCVCFVRSDEAHKLQAIIILDIYKTCTLNQRFFMASCGQGVGVGVGVGGDFPTQRLLRLFIAKSEVNQKRRRERNQFEHHVLMAAIKCCRAASCMQHVARQAWRQAGTECNWKN